MPTKVALASEDGRRVVRVLRVDREDWLERVELPAPDGPQVLILTPGVELERVELFSLGEFHHVVLSDLRRSENGVLVELPDELLAFELHTVDGRSALVQPTADVPRSSTLTVPFAEVVDLELELVDLSGHPVSDVELTLVPKHGDPRSSAFEPVLSRDGIWSWRAGNVFEARVDGRGRSRLALPAGTYKVRVHQLPWRFAGDRTQLCAYSAPFVAAVPGSASRRLVVQRPRRIDLDCAPSAVDALPAEWAVHLNGEAHSQLLVSGPGATLWVTDTDRSIEIRTREGDLVDALELRPGMEVLRLQFTPWIR